MSGLWLELLRDLDRELVEALTLLKVVVSRDGRRLEIRLKASRLLTKEEYQAIKEAMRSGFLGMDARVTLSYPDLRARVEESISEFTAFLADRIVDENPGVMPYIVWETAEWRLKEGKLKLRIKDKFGAAYLRDQSIDRRIEQLMKSLFLIECRVTVEVTGDEDQRLKEIAEKRLLEQERIVEKTRTIQRVEEKKAKKPTGALLGKPFNDPPVAIEELTENAGRVVLRGEVISFELRDLKNGTSKLLSFSITDYSGSVQCKAFLGGKRSNDSQESLEEQATALKAYMKPGEWVTVRGEYRYDDFLREMVLMARDMVPAHKPRREDTAEVKRVELHLHTQMSAMDACSSPSDLIAQAAAWGHPAIAITDHGVVQAFPEAFGAAKKHKIKLIPGMEGYLVDDYAKIVTRADERLLDDTPVVVFDVETTGLKSALDEIIELGAVRFEGGKEVAEFSQLINPMRPLPAKITEITGITDGMLVGKPTIERVIAEFKAFCEGAVLVAHNADFDAGFVGRAFERCGYVFDHPIIDTLLFSRNQLTELKSHKLGTIAKHLGIKLLKAHRAVHDARATGLVYFEILKKAREDSSLDRLDQLNSRYVRNAGGSSYHIILLAKSQVGMTNLYRLVSEAHLNHFYRTPRLPRHLIDKWREGLIVGSACEAGELYTAVREGRDWAELLRIAKFYDYLEIQPLDNNAFLTRQGLVKDEEALKEINRKIVRLADELGIPCVATGDVHFKEPEDAKYRAILMASKGFDDADDQPPLYFKTTNEMLEEFEYLGVQAARRVVVDAPREIADRVGDVRLFIEHPDGQETFQPFWPEAEDDIRSLSEGRAKEIYGENLPNIVRKRLDKELGAIIGYGFATLYDIAVKLVKRSLEDGYIVGSRGSVGSSLVAYLTGITEVNSLPPHYVCPDCKHAEFDVPEEYACGLDLPDKHCPECSALMLRDGYDIPFEVFLGFNGDKVPDIDLNFSGEYQPRAHAYVKEMFGAENVFRAGTIGTVAEKTAYGYVLKYLEERGQTATNAEKERLALGMTGVKRTTGQHPAGMVVLPQGYEIYQFTAIQHPADDMNSDTVTTHFDFGSMHDVLVKLDVLGHDDPTMLRKLQDLTGIAPADVPLHDKAVFREILSLFRGTEALGIDAQELGSATGTLGVPEFGTRFVRQMLVDTQPTTMEELLRISGLSHGTDVWIGNVQDIVKNGIAPLLKAVCTRDDIMNQLIKWGIENKIAFDTMESVRKGRGLTPVMEQAMAERDVPEWYVTCLKKIKYMFPKAHAAAYVLMALRIAYFKINYPTEYYACYFRRNLDDFDGNYMVAGIETIRGRMEEIEELDKDEKAKKENEFALLEIIVEMLLRGIRLLPVSMYESDPEEFLVMPDKTILPPLTSIKGLGLQAAQRFAAIRLDGPFISREDMIRRKVPKSVVEMLAQNGCLGDLPETSQISLFDF